MDDVIIADYNPQWPSLYAQEAQRLRDALGAAVVEIEHVGSTSVEGLAAKPVIDLLLIVRSLADAEQAVPALATEGYEYLGENGIPGRLFFRKGMPRTHHLHIVESGHHQWPDNLDFRDYLRAHPDEAARYEALKRSLAERFRYQRDDYTSGKSSYILGVLEKAREEEDERRHRGL